MNSEICGGVNQNSGCWVRGWEGVQQLTGRECEELWRQMFHVLIVYGVKIHAYLM